MFEARTDPHCSRASCSVNLRAVAVKTPPKPVRCGPRTTPLGAVVPLTFLEALLDWKAAVDGGLVAVVGLWALLWSRRMVIVFMRRRSPLLLALAAAAEGASPPLFALLSERPSPCSCSLPACLLALLPALLLHALVALYYIVALPPLRPSLLLLTNYLQQTSLLAWHSLPPSHSSGLLSVSHLFLSSTLSLKPPPPPEAVTVLLLLPKISHSSSVCVCDQ